MIPLVTASRAEKAKHTSYDAECAKQGWKLVPFALESYGAKGKAAEQLLQRMSSHSIDRSPESFLLHAESVLSVALQTGNASVSSAGTADLHFQAYRRKETLQRSIFLFEILCLAASNERTIGIGSLSNL
jgi:hypothetical protein